MRVLIFSLVYFPKLVGGAEVAIREITDRINPEHIEFDMITLRFDSALPKFERIGNVNVYRIGFTRPNPSMQDLVRFPMYLNKVFYPALAAWKAIRLHRKRQYDGFWAMMSYMGFPIVLFRIFSRTKMPYVLTLQEGDPIPHITGRWRIKVVAGLFRRVFRESTVVQAISKYLALWAKDMGASSEPLVIYNGVEVKRFQQKHNSKELSSLRRKMNATAHDVLLITISRLVKKNAVDDVIRAIKLLPRQVKFAVIGRGPDEGVIRKLIQTEGVADRVFLMGEISNRDIDGYLQAADIFIRPSRSEGLGISFIEAMAAGRPIIGTPVGGIPEFLFDPREGAKKPTGLMAQPNNPQSIADAVEWYLSHPHDTLEIIENAQELVSEKFDWDMIAKDMQSKVFAQLLASQSKA